MLEDIIKSVAVSVVMAALYWMAGLLGARKRRQREYREALELLALESQIKEHDLTPAGKERYAELKSAFGDLSLSAGTGAARPQEFDWGDFWLAMFPSIAVSIVVMMDYVDGHYPAVPVLAILCILVVGALGAVVVHWVVNKVTRHQILGYVMSIVLGFVWLIGPVGLMVEFGML